MNTVIVAAGNVVAKTENLVYQFMKFGPVALVLASSLLFFSYSNIDEDTELATQSRPKEIGGFYFGVYDDPMSRENNVIARSEVVPVDRVWDTTNCILIETNPIAGKTIPLINWLPVSPDSGKIYEKISAGLFDNYLQKCAACFRDFSGPVFLNFAPAFDSPLNSWYISSSGAREYVKAWQHVYTFFNNLGISNITWIWSPGTTNSASYYPGPKFVDWLGVSCLNYGNKPADKNWCSFSQLYAPFRKSYGALEKPVMIYEFSSQSSTHSASWFSDAFKKISSSYKEINSVVVYNREKDFIIREGGQTKTYTVDFRISHDQLFAVLNDKLSQERFRNVFLEKEFLRCKRGTKYKSPFITGSPGNYSFVVNSKSYYIRGIAYNTAHDWRDGNMPLTRKQVEHDFEKIKEMGANTIRRYDHGVYDRNVLNIANEYGLKVMYGFWFDPKIDYYKDSAGVEKYMEDVEDKVMQFKDHSSVLAWSLGNETWGLLKHRYAKPYLTKVRDAYVKMIERLAQRIHEIDPAHPVFSCMEHEEYQIPGELVAFHDGAPSVDVIGINSYYREQISKLNHLTWEFDSLRPYLVSEFGPRGYWDPKYNRVKHGSLVEDNDTEKANWYAEQWDNYVYAHKGYNIGGFAYCWHDRMEGSNTWFGLTDFKGRPKAAYYTLKKTWTHEKDILPVEVTIVAPSEIKAGEKYVFAASTSSPLNGKYKYEWYLHKDEYLGRVDNVEIIDEGKQALVEVPVKPSNYRLYLYVSDEQNRVSTASVPVKVK